MNEIERKQWENARAQGATKYVLKTSILATFLVVIIYIIGNAYDYKNEINAYIEHNLGPNLNYNLSIIGVSYVLIAIITLILWKVNERRYKNSQKGKN